MEIIKPAVAGTLESSDVQVSVEPTTEGLDISVQSSVLNQYGRQIRQTTLATLTQMGVANARVTLVDKGALDCTIVARVQCAVYRACGVTEGYPWGEERKA